MIRARALSLSMALLASACGTGMDAGHDAEDVTDAASDVSSSHDVVASDAREASTNDVATDHPAATDTGSDATAADVQDSGTSGGPASPCGAWHGTSAWSCGSNGHTLTRSVSGMTETYECANGCIGLPFGFDDQCRVRAGTVSNTVNGHTLSGVESGWIHYVAYCVVPRIQGTRSTRLQNASRVAWWALKEGVLDATSPNPVGFSLCTTSSGDQRIGPTATCGSGAPWQVGASGVQVTCCSLSSLESMATTLYPGMTSNQVLTATATEATYAGTSTETAIVGSTGSLRASWLLRNSAVGFTFQVGPVTSQCITGSYGWCYGTGWDTSSWYAPNKTAALGSISDIQGILDVLSP